MTPKEKAFQLVKRYYKDYDLSKECALIAVDEILNSRPAITDSQIEYQKYWEEVKHEINKLKEDKQ